MKKKLAVVFTAVLLVLGAMLCCFTACTLSNPGPMSKLKGTYKLEQFDRSYPDGRETADLLARDKITAYFVIDGTEFGYLVYSDEEEGRPMPLTCRQVAVEYEYSEGTENVSKVSYKTVRDPNKRMISDMSFGFMSRDGELNLTLPNVELQGSIPNLQFVTTHTDYFNWKKVDKATDLSYVQKQVGELPPYAPCLLLPYDGGFEMASYLLDNKGYLYYFIEIDAYAQTAEIYYALSGDGNPVQRTVAVTFAAREDDPTVLGTLTIEGKTYTATGGSFNEMTELPDGNVDMTVFDSFGGDIQERIQTILESQQEEKPQEGPTEEETTEQA